MVIVMEALEKTLDVIKPGITCEEVGSLTYSKTAILFPDAGY